MRVMIVVTHLLGTGHLSRARALADGFAAAGHEALLVSGGRAAPHLAPRAARLLELPSVASDGVNFTRLLDETGAAAGPERFAARTARLLDALHVFAPDALIVELFPFGRRVLAAEFEALLDAARRRSPRPRLYSSVRDVLAPPSSEKKIAETERRLQTFYDGVLVHGEAAITPLDASWPITATMAPMLRYTGFVADPLPRAAPTGDGRDEVVVTAGGGPVGGPLFNAAVAAAKGHDLLWRLLIGGSDQADRIAALRAQAAGAANVFVEPVRPDFRELIQRAAVSVNQAGYNTMLDIAAAGVRSVVAPFEEGGETEQAQRAAAFGARYGYELVREATLDGPTLRAAVERARAADPPHKTQLAPPPDLGGVAETVRIVARAVAEISASGREPGLPR